MVNCAGSTDDFSRWKPDNLRDHLTTVEVARLVGRTKERLLQLERAGKIPIPVRVKVGELSVRLYSRAEAATIANYFKHAKPGNPGKGGSHG